MRSAEWDAWVARARAVPIEDEAASRGIKLKGRGTHRAGPCPVCGGVDRFSLNIKKQVFHCRGCKRAGNTIALVEFCEGVDFTRACEILTGEPPPKAKPKANGKDRGAKPARKIQVAEFLYHDSDGRLALSVLRYEFVTSNGSHVLDEHGKRKKEFAQRRPDPQRPSAWIWNAEHVPPLIYELPKVLEAVRSGREIVICEGEGKVDLYWSWGIPATCCVGGAGGKWSAAHSEFLRGAPVVLQPDNDNPGFHYINVIGAALEGIAASTRVLLLPGLPAKGDIVDWKASGGTAEQLRALLAEAPLWQPPPVDEGKPDDDAKKRAEEREDELLEALRKMPAGIKRSRARKAAAKELGVAMGDIDAAIKALQEEEEIAPLYEHWNVTPWPEPVDGDRLLRDIINYIERHVICSPEAALTTSLWTIHAWVHDEVAVYSPLLVITSAERECGKSTLMGVISFLMPRCIKSVEISGAALYRAIERWHPSFCIDEFDNILADDQKLELRSVINAGHTRGDGVLRCVEPDYTPKLFEVFAPKCIGMIGRKMPDSTLSRCIFIELQRRMRDEEIVEFKHEDNPELANLRSRLLRWSIDHVEILRRAKPAMPFTNRQGNNWGMLLAVSDLCSKQDDENWGSKARAAAKVIEGTTDTMSLRTRLLADIKRVFDNQLQDDLFTEQELPTQLLLDKLNDDQESPWGTWYGRGLNANDLSSLLNGGGGKGRGHRSGASIQSRNIRYRDRDGHSLQAKGYRRKDLEGDWERYVPKQDSSDEETAE